MSSDWDEIKKLAADFQKVQLTSTLQKLSERNCIEIVQLLLKKQLVNVVFTNDGKEYITPEHLEREILDELYVNGGRANLVEIAKTLNVDLTRINEIAGKISEDDPQIHFMLGQLINEDYIISIAQEINEKLQQSGEINISDLTVQFDLPSEFIQGTVMEKNLGKIIKGRQDQSNQRVFFTQAYITRCKCKIRGALAALTRPTNISNLIQQINVPEKLFHSIIDEINPAGSVTSKQSNALYIPNIYAKMQSDWVNSFFKQNGFLEYDSISKLGISDPKSFIKKMFPDEDMIFLERCAVGSKIADLTLLSALNECQMTKSYVDLATILPSNFSEEDIEELFHNILNIKNIPNNFVYLETTAFSKTYLQELLAPCNEMALANAKSAVESGIYQKYIAEKQIAANRNGDNNTDGDLRSDKRDDRRKKAVSGKAGGGAQGRETKTKSTKKHQRGGKNYKDEDSEEEADLKTSKKTIKDLELVKRGEIERVIRKKLEEEYLDHLSNRITDLYLDNLNKIALQEAQKLFEATPQSNRRQTHSSLQEKINILLSDIRLYEKGVKILPENLHQNLLKYVLKSLGNDICNELTIYVAGECNLQLKNADNMNLDQRNKITQECDAEYKGPLMELNKALNKDLDEFLEAVEVALKACSMIVKKVDKKKDRLLILEHKHKLCQQLHETSDHALTLHLIVLILFITLTGNIIHASGKFVSQIYNFLLTQNIGDQIGILTKYHDNVLKLLIADEGSDEQRTLTNELNELQKDVKDFVINFEKPGLTKAD